MSSLIYKPDQIAVVSGTVAVSAVSGTVTVSQSYSGMESFYQTLSGSTDTTITFSQAVRLIRVQNFDTTNVLLVKNGAISTDADSGSSRVGIAPASNVPNGEWYPISTTTIHLRSVGTNIVCVDGFI